MKQVEFFQHWNKALLTPVHGVSYVRFKFRGQILLLPQIRCLSTLRVDSIISIDRNTTNTINRLGLMYGRKSVGRMGTINWTFLQGFPIRNHSKPLLKKDKISPNTWHKLIYDLNLWKRPACQTLSKTFEISSVTKRVAPNVSNARANISDKIVVRFSVDIKT